MSLLLLISATLLLRFLAAQAKAAFVCRSKELLGREIPRNRLEQTLREAPSGREAFRTRALPFAALQVGLDSLACLALLGALFIFPPGGLGSVDLWILQRVGLLVVGVAFAIEVRWLGMVFLASLPAMSSSSESD